MGIIFLVFAIIYLIRRPKIKQMQAAQYPHVPYDAFERWKRYEILSIDIFLVCAFIPTISVTLFQVVAASVAPSANSSDGAWLPMFGIVAVGGGIVIFLV